MRLVGGVVDGATWVLLARDDVLVPLAPVERFWADVDRGMALAREAAATAPPADTMLHRGEVPPAVPIAPTAKVLCVGLNYVSHVAETERDVPTVPDVFARWPSTLVPAGHPVPVPHGEPGLDWEGELAAVVGSRLHAATPEQVEAAVLTWTCFNDLSARRHQRASPHWAVGKNADRSGPIGPELVTADELGDPYDLRLVTRVDGRTVQDGRTGDMLFRVGAVGAFATETITLEPGDVIATGTPAGIGARRTPPQWLGPGSVVEVEIERIGVLRTPVTAPQPPVAGRTPALPAGARP